MTSVKVLGSSSAGNCYLVNFDGHILILEAGIKFADIEKGLDYDLSHVCGCIISHRHKDHARALPDVLKAGIHVHAIRDVFDSVNCPKYGMHTISDKANPFRVGRYFTVMALPVLHDCPCTAFLISTPDHCNILFATDTYAFPYSLKNIDLLLIEANYSDEVLSYNVEQGYIDAAMRDRLLLSHMEISNTIQCLRHIDDSRLKRIVLIHLSKNNSNASKFVEIVESASGVPTDVARPGNVYESNSPY